MLSQECATEMGGKTARQDTGKFSQETKDLIRKQQSMIVSTTADNITSGAFKVNKCKTAGIRKYMERIEHAIKNRDSL